MKTVLQVSDDNISYFNQPSKSKKRLTDKQKLVEALSSLEQSNFPELNKIMNEIPQKYFILQFHKDLSRALLCWITFKTTHKIEFQEESQFYLTIFYLTKRTLTGKLHYQWSSYIYELEHTLFKDFEL